MGIILSAVRILGALLLIGGTIGTIPGCMAAGLPGVAIPLGVAVLGLLMTQVRRFV